MNNRKNIFSFVKKFLTAALALVFMLLPITSLAGSLITLDVNIVATGIVCNSESDLPNWGAGSENISQYVIDQFLETHPNCHTESGWSFEWNDDDSVTDPGQSATGVAGWNTFGPTDNNRYATTSIGVDFFASSLSVRVVTREGYIPFSYSSDSNSAEMYCAEDVMNYDNFETIEGPFVTGNVYYCVAFNVSNAPAVNTPPTITLLGNNPLNLNVGDTFVEPGYTAIDAEDGNITASTTVSGTVSTSTAGTYTLTYSVTDSGGLSTSTTRSIVVSSSTPTLPSVSLTANPSTITPGATSTLSWTSQNVTSCSATWTLATSTSGSKEVNPATTTDYVISCTGAHGNTYATSTVTVSTTPIPSNTAPVITLIGNNPLNLNVGDTFTEPGYTATDTEDGDLTASTTVSGTVSTSTAGTYTLTYSVTDSGGLSAATTRSVIVSVIPTSSGGGGGGGGGGSSIGGHRRDISGLLATQGEILGASSCSYLNDYLKIDWQNNPVEVLKLQSFLNAFEGENLSLTSVFDQQTFDAVERFQIKYNDDVLNPWGYSDDHSTGFVYILTKKKVNEIFCNTMFPVSSLQQDEIDSFRNSSFGGLGLSGSDKLSTIGDAVSKDALVVELENGSTSTSTVAGSIVKNAAVSLFALPEKIFSNSRSIVIFLIMAAIIAAIISLFRSSNSNSSDDDSGNEPVLSNKGKSDEDSPVIVLPGKDKINKSELSTDEEIIIENPDEEEVIEHN